MRIIAAVLMVITVGICHAQYFPPGGGGGGPIFGGGLMTESQKSINQAYLQITQGGNLALSGTTPQTVVLVPAVSCTTRFSRVLISITTSFSGGTGALTVKLQHGSVDLTPQFNILQTGGDINFYSDIPGPGCLGTGTAALQLVFTGNGANNMNLFTAGSLKIEVAGYTGQA